MKRVSVRLTDEEISFLYAVVDVYVGDIAASGDNIPPETERINRKLLRARLRVRASNSAPA
jgi:hypothetical protein